MRRSERAGLRGKGGWCHKLLSAAPPYVFRVDFHTVKLRTAAVVSILQLSKGRDVHVHVVHVGFQRSEKGKHLVSREDWLLHSENM